MLQEACQSRRASRGHASSFVCQPFVFAFVVGVPGRVAVSPLAAGETGAASKPASPVAGPTQVWCNRSQRSIVASLHARESFSEAACHGGGL